MVDGVLRSVSTATLRNNITNVLPTNQAIGFDNVTLGGAFVRTVVPVPVDVREAATNISAAVRACIADG